MQLGSGMNTKFCKWYNMGPLSKTILYIIHSNDMTNSVRRRRRFPSGHYFPLLPQLNITGEDFWKAGHCASCWMNIAGAVPAERRPLSSESQTKLNRCAGKRSIMYQPPPTPCPLPRLSPSLFLAQHLSSHFNTEKEGKKKLSSMSSNRTETDSDHVCVSVASSRAGVIPKGTWMLKAN